MIEDDNQEEGADRQEKTMPPPARVELERLPAFKPDLYHRAWSSTPHPTLPLLATAHEKSVTVFSLSDLSAHSSLTGGHTRSVRSAVWRPGMAPGKLCLVTGSFDSTAGLWRWEKEAGAATEVDVTGQQQQRQSGDDDNDAADADADEDEWEFTLVLEGHENEVKSVAFAPSGHLLATCSRDKSIWIWEDVGASEGDDEWETVSVLTEHDGDVKCV
ncbi:cytosolic iron-sulfur protein assembly protein 1, partial [Magnaporthiopsis poae ATCC 64411]